MTRYSRSVIPGRQAGDNSSDLDRIVFGKRPTTAANDSNDDDDDGVADVTEGEAAMLVERAATDRRKGKRRRSDFAPLPGEARQRPSEGSKRGPLLLVGALVIVAVFSVVVWNAYRDGVRPGEAGAAPLLADAGPIKTKPAETTESKFVRPDYGATVFEQVETAKQTVQPAPEVRAEPVVPPPQKPAAAATAPAPVQAQPKAAAPVATSPKATTSAPVKPPVQTAAASAKPTAPAPTPVKPATNPAPAPLQVATATSAPAKPAETVLAGGYTPAFSPAGKFVVQVGAPSSEAGAISEWNRKAKAAPELFGTAERFIVQADVNGRTVYRLRAGSFATAADADGFCNAFKAKGGECFRTMK